MRRLTHAAGTILLGGWVLMFPPQGKERQGMYNMAAPLDDWVRGRAFDTAYDCEQAKKQLFNDAAQRLDNATTDRQATKAKDDELSATMARCVWSDHPPKFSWWPW